MRPILGLTVLGFAVFSQTLYGERPGRASDAAIRGARATVGPGIPSDLQLPVFAPVRADYRTSVAPVEGHNVSASIGPRVLPVWEHSDGMAKVPGPVKSV